MTRLNLFLRWMVLIESPTACRDYIHLLSRTSRQQPSLGLFEKQKGDCRLEYMDSARQSNREVAGSDPRRRVLDSLVAQQCLWPTTSSPIEYRPTAGWSTCFESRWLWVRVPPAPLSMLRCSSMAEHRKVSDQPLVGPFETTGYTLDCRAEYMVNQVRFLTGPLDTP